MIRLRAIPRTRGMSSSEAAADWLVRHDDGPLTPSEEAEFKTWLDDPANADAWRRGNRAIALFEGGMTASDPSLRALRQSALEARPAPRLRYFAAGGALTAAGIAALVAILAVPNTPKGPVQPPGSTLAAKDTSPTATAPAPARMAAREIEYSTGIGERRTIKLADGTEVTLNTRTKLVVAYTAERRLVRLVRGQALFDVAHNRERPFTVEAVDRQITALGTMFEVRVGVGQVNVVLVKGRVVVDRVSEARNGYGAPSIQQTVLVPGQQFTAELGAPQRVTRVDTERQLLWRSGFVEFDDEPLGRVVNEMNRYFTRPVTLANDNVASLRVSGVFQTNSPSKFVDLIQSTLPIEAKASASGEMELSLAPKGQE